MAHLMAATLTATLRRTLIARSSPSLLTNSRLLPSPLDHQSQQLRYASKKRAGSKGGAAARKDNDAADSDEIAVQDHPVPVVAKGKKARAAGHVSSTQAMEQFKLDTLEASMDNAIERLQRELKSLVGRVERLSPALLDGVRVQDHGERHPLQSYATVSVSGSDALMVNIFDAASVKSVERAIRETLDLNLNPQKVDETTFRVPVPKPDLATRSTLAKKASDLAENTRTSIRAARHEGQKNLKADQDNKVVGESDARRDAKHLQDATKKRTDEVDQIFARVKKIIMDD